MLVMAPSSPLVASSRLLELDANRLAQAIALSATSIGGLVAAADTSVAREHHAGLATLLGVNAALAASRDYRCEPRILEMRRGFFETIGGADGEAASAEVLRDLGESWDPVTDVAIRLVPGGHPYHALAKAAANAVREGGLAADEIASITVSRPGMTAFAWSTASHQPDRYGAQPYLLRGGRCGRWKVLMGTCRPQRRSPIRQSTG